MAILAVLAFVIAPMLGAASHPSGAIAPPILGDSEEALLDLRGVLDSDLDGVSDALENYAYGTDPTAWSSNGDRIPDGWYARYGYDPLEPHLSSRPAATPPPDALPPAYGNEWPSRFTPTLWEVYAHGRPSEWNESEQGLHESGIDPREWDQNGDHVADGFLLASGLDPLEEGVGPRKLAGGGGLSVLEAFQHGTNPRLLDSDGDGLTDREEIDGPVNPLPDGPSRFAPSDPSRTSTAGSGVCDGYLVAHGLDPSIPANSYGDPDDDGATTLEEYLWSRDRFGDGACQGEGADPTKQSTAGLPIPDGWLIQYGLDPLDPATPSRETQDSATDPGPTLADPGPDVTLTVLDEYNLGRPPAWDEARDGVWWGGTDPSKTDTDGDGLGDAWELRGYQVTVNAVPTRSDPTTYPTGSDPTRADSDGDGLTDGEEASPDLGPETVTDALRRDTDFDGIDDGTEVLGDFGLDPTNADSAGDLLRDGVRLRFLEEHARAYLVDLTYEHTGEPGVARSVADWIGDMAGAEGLSKPLSKKAVADLVGPTGDLDGDGIQNVLDDDIDDDGLRNGFELTPALYEHSQFGEGRLAGGRPASDPLNPDTDGDLLPDGWEVGNGIEDHARGIYNLDPSRWDSDGDGTADTHEDPDGDSIVWYTYARSGDFHERQEKKYEHTNHQEFIHGTHPNQASADGDGLLDGWRVFWGIEYPALGPSLLGDLYPGSDGPFGLTLPTMDVSLDSGKAGDVLTALQYKRHVLRTSDLVEAYDESASNGVRVPGPDGERTLYPVHGAFPITLLAAQEAHINPYMAMPSETASTDGDGMSDAWELLHQQVLPGTADLLGADQAGCVAGVPGPDPTLHDSLNDLDGDGLPNGGEHSHGADPLCQDSDMGLLLDGQEVSETLETPLDPADPKDDRQLLDSQEDSDSDGMFDFEELTGTARMSSLYPQLGLVRTDPNNPDTDRDGLLDGATHPDPDVACNGWTTDDPRTQRFLDLGIAYFPVTCGQSGHEFEGTKLFHFLGEADSGTDPRNGDDTGTGVPAGWLAAYSKSLGEAAKLQDQYTLARPTWWDEAAHGVWWGGASPLLYPDPSPLQRDFDLDKDGLQDRDGFGNPFEDPMPGANTHNALRDVNFTLHGIPAPTTSDPAATDLDPLAKRLLGQAYLNPRVVGSKALGRPGPDDLKTPSWDAPCITDMELDTNDTIVKGTPKIVHGRVLYPGSDGTCSDGTGVAGVTVEARMGTSLSTQVFGLGVTGADGRFSLPIDIAQSHRIALPASAVAMGQAGGDVTWNTSPSEIAPGDGHTLRLRTYARLDPDSPDGNLTRSEPVSITGVTVRAGSAITLHDLPASAPAGSELQVRLTLTDSTGTPLRDSVRLRLGHLPWTDSVTPDPNGAASVSFNVPFSMTGDVALKANSTPSSPHVTAAQTEATVRFLQPTTLRLDVLPTTADAGSMLTVSGRLSTQAGSVPGASVEVTVSAAGETVAATNATTGPDGRFQLDVPLDPTLAGGTYIVQATATATNTTASTQSSQETLSLRSLPRFAAVSTEGLNAAQDSFNVTGRLLEPDGTPVPGAPVTASLGGFSGTATTDENGGFMAQIDATLAPIPVLQSLHYAGDAAHAPARHTLERSVHTETVLHLPPATLARGAAAEVGLVLEDVAGNAVPGAAVVVSWGEEIPQTVVTDAEGQATFLRPGDPDDALGSVVVRAAYNGSRDGTLGGSQASAVWVVEAQARLTLPQGSFELTEELPPGSLHDAGTGRPLTRQPVHLNWTQVFVDGPTINGSSIVRTDDRGRFQALPPTFGGEAPSRITLRAEHDGGEVYGLVQNNATLLLRSPTSLDPQAPGRLVADRPVLVLVPVTDGRDLAVTGGHVNVTVDDHLVGQAPVVDGLARVTIVLPADREAGPATLRFRFDGTDTHGPSTADRPIQVVQQGQLELRIHGATPGKATLVEAMATAGGRPLPFTPVTIQVEGMPSGIEAVTDEDGVARFEVLQGNGTLRMAASLGGDEAHSPATAHGLLVPAVPEGPGRGVLGIVAWVAAALGVALAVTAVLVRRLRRHDLAPALRRARLALDGRGPYEEQILKAYQILEDAAIAHQILDEPAMTPRMLEEAIQVTVAPTLHPSLHRLISFFEVARYGTQTLEKRHLDQAMSALDDLRSQLSKMDPFWQESDAPGGWTA